MYEADKLESRRFFPFFEIKLSLQLCFFSAIIQGSMTIITRMKQKAKYVP